MFPYDDYLKLAREWEQEKDNAHKRCAVSRAYYACFHLAKLVGENENKKFSKGGAAHKEVLVFLLTHNNPSIQKAGEKQKNLWRQRGMCDYKASMKNIGWTANTALQDAAAIFSCLKPMLTP